MYGSASDEALVFQSITGGSEDHVFQPQAARSMSAKLVLAGGASIIIGAIVCSASRRPALRLIGGLLFALVSVATTAVTGLLVWVGMRSGWSSDGPGMLLVMIGVLIFGAASLVGWRATASALLARKWSVSDEAKPSKDGASQGPKAWH